MHRKAVAVVLVLVALAVISGCAAYQAQHAGGAGPAASHEHHKMQPPSSLFTMKSNEEKLAEIHGELEETKKSLAEEGKYACCIRPSCNQCLLSDGACPCRKMIEGQGLGCGECMAGWAEGRGALEGVTAGELLERQEQQREGEKPPVKP